jgi:TonB family protein
VSAIGHPSTDADGAAAITGLTVRGSPSALSPSSLSRNRLIFAVAASAAIHASLFATPFVGFGPGSGPLTLRNPPLQAALVPALEPTTTLATESEYWSTPSVQPEAPPPSVVAAVAERASAPLAQPSLRAGVPADVPVEAEQVISISRIGAELLERTTQEFPVEIGWPVRIHGKIVARYPAAALEAGREGTVIVWVVVDPNANVEEIQVAEGAEDFAEAAIEAVKAAQFQPAAFDGVGVRYPIALEFRFALGISSAPPETLTAATP